ncbi:hypothetical protein B0T10DRAFT_464310 [Thelonectria olida]|uniref:Uncharacterized protein n=1 Tax=Thelonectria olida TaxID=1576542 RepID=A0A9P8VVM3_9HYPO|nr:hypothetical protein B0T10DRAFT_464310 [Thelonectria olida]
MNDSATPKTSCGSHNPTPSPAELFKRCLQERRREEYIENERLRRELQCLKAEFTNTTTIVSWQQQLAALGEVHIKLLENFIARLHSQPLDPKLIESEQIPSCGQSMYTPSSFCMTEDYPVESSHLASSADLVYGQDDNDAKAHQAQAQGTASAEFWGPSN